MPGQNINRVMNIAWNSQASKQDYEGVWESNKPTDVYLRIAFENVCPFHLFKH